MVKWTWYSASVLFPITKHTKRRGTPNIKHHSPHKLHFENKGSAFHKAHHFSSTLKMPPFECKTVTIWSAQLSTLSVNVTLVPEKTEKCTSRYLEFESSPAVFNHCYIGLKCEFHSYWVRIASYSEISIFQIFLNYTVGILNSKSFLCYFRLVWAYQTKTLKAKTIGAGWLATQKIMYVIYLGNKSRFYMKSHLHLLVHSL